MRICIVNFEPLETAGGAGTSSFSIAKELAKQGQDVYYIVRSLDADITSKEHDITIIRTCLSFYEKPKIIPLKIYQYCVYPFRDVSKMRKILTNIQPDVVLSFNILPAFYVMVNNFGRKNKIPFIISFRHDPLLRRTFLLPQKAKKLWKYHPVILSASYFTSPSCSLARNIGPYIKRKIDVIPNGIDSTLYYQNYLSNPNKLHRPIVLCLSRLSPEKRVEDAILSMPKLLEQHPHMVLRIVGDGNERDSLENLVKELNLSQSVEFVGHIPHNEVLSYYHSATVFLLPSNDEGFPNTFLEAIACGLPVVTTPVGDLNEVVTNAGNGVIVNHQSPHEIAEAISMICSDSKTYADFSNKSLELAKKYSWEEVGHEYNAYIVKRFVTQVTENKKSPSKG